MATANPGPYLGPTPAQLQAAATALQNFTASLTAAMTRLSAGGPGGGHGGGGRKPKRPWWKRLSLQAGGAARKGFGAKAGRATAAGVGAAGQALAKGWPVGMAARSGATAALGAAGPAGAAVALLAAAAVKAVDALNKLTEQQIQYNRHLADASAVMAGVVARRDVEEFQRNKEKGDRLGKSAEELYRSEQDYKENTKEIDILWERIKNNVGAGWEKVKTAVLSPLNELAKAINKQTETKNEFKDLGFGEWAALNLDKFRDRDTRKDPIWTPPPGQRSGEGFKGG